MSPMSDASLSAGEILLRLTASATLAAGALLHGAGSAALTTLALGTAGRVLVAGASAPAWSDAGLSYASGVLAIAGSAPGTPSAGQVLIGGGAVNAGGVITASDFGAGITPAGTYGSNTIWGKFVSVGGQFNVHTTVGGNYEFVHRGAYGFDWYTGAGGVLGLSLVNGTLATGYLHIKHTGATALTVAGGISSGGLLNVTNSIAGNNSAYVQNTNAAGYGPVIRGGGGGAGLYTMIVQRYDGSQVYILDENGAAAFASGVAAGGTISTTIADATSGFKIQRATDDSQMLFGYSGGQFRIAATYGSTGAYKDVTIYTGDVERLTASAAGVINIYGTTPSTPGSTEVRIGNGQIKAGAGISSTTVSASTNITVNASVSAAYRGIDITNSAADGYAQLNMYSGTLQASHNVAIGLFIREYQNGTVPWDWVSASGTALTLTAAGAATFGAKIGANGAAASSTMTGATLPDLITWLQSFIA